MVYRHRVRTRWVLCGVQVGIFPVLLPGALLCAQQPLPSAPSASLPRFEVGFQASDIRTDCVGQRNCSVPSAGLGFAAAMNLTPHVALEARWVGTPTSASATTNQSGGHETEFLAGARAELRARHFGFYSFGGLGYRRWGDLITGVADTPSPPAPPGGFSFSYGSRTDLAASFAGGVEASPTSRVHVRGEVGDLLIERGGHWTSNLQPSVGVFYGFGTPMTWTPPRDEPRNVHPFFDRTNFAALGVNALASTADNVTTYQFMRRGIREGDPIVRPLVKYGVPGQVSCELLETGLLMAGMYGLHRLHQHWAERLAPLVDATGHGILAYRNTLSYSRSQPTR